MDSRATAPTPAAQDPKSGPALVEVEKASLSFGSHLVLSEIDLRIDTGEFICVVGPSGCGKTTLLRMLGGFAKASAGKVMIDGRAVDGPRQDVAIVFQDYSKALLPWRTAAGNVALALEARGVPKSEHAPLIDRLLDVMGLLSSREKFPSELSGGMQQRLQIARCLAQEPKLLLMDEPFGALDAMTRQRLQDELLSLVAKTGMTVFFITHDLEEAIYLGDRVIGLNAHPGRIGQTFDVRLPKPRNQLDTPEDPEFLHLRRGVFEFIEAAEK
ncbi:MAG: ABC transporter ATP-binding protein [Pseudomonadota bacterium]|nr:ABC transporter ATP-binding protein [Pseudomonadota bacterium]